MWAVIQQLPLTVMETRNGPDRCFFLVVLVVFFSVCPGPVSPPTGLEIVGVFVFGGTTGGELAVLPPDDWDPSTTIAHTPTMAARAVMTMLDSLWCRLSGRACDP